MRELRYIQITICFLKLKKKPSSEPELNVSRSWASGAKESDIYDRIDKAYPKHSKGVS